MNNPNQQAEIKKLALAFEQLEDAEPILLQITADGAFMLLAQLQLALRHPANRGETAEVIKHLAVELQQRIVERVPEVQSVLDAGWHPECDQKVEDTPKRLLYQHLALDIQEEVLANSIAFSMACQTLAKMTGLSVGAFVQQFSQYANDAVDSMTDFTVREAVENLDKLREDS
jgi:hypothetical protein